MSHLPYPRVEPLGGNRYRLSEPYRYTWTKDGRRYRITVPGGFENDLASVPRALWWLISPFDLGLAAVPHDWLYAHAGRVPPGTMQEWRAGEWQEVATPWTRRDADRLFARLMRDSHVAPWKRRAAYLAVRLLGGRAWRSRDV